MIAICPSCHDAVHHGPLVIDDDTVYRWKGIKREAEPRRDHVYVEPGGPPRLLLGTIAVTGDDGLVVFQLGPTNTLSFRVEDEDLLMLNLGVTDTAGRDLLRVTDNHVRQIDSETITYERVPGHVRVTAELGPEIVPTWAIDRLRKFEPDYGTDESVVVLDLGYWSQDSSAFRASGRSVTIESSSSRSGRCRFYRRGGRGRSVSPVRELIRCSGTAGH
jgi:hypothetical protein